VTAKQSSSSSSSSSNSTATYDVICKRRNATDRKAAATYITENMSRLLLIVGKDYPDGIDNNYIKQFVEQVTRVGKLAQGVVYSNNSNATLNEKDNTLQSELGKLDNIILLPIVTDLLKKHDVFPSHLINASRANAGVAPFANASYVNASRTPLAASAASVNASHTTVQDALVLAKNVSINIQDYKYPNKNFQENLTILRQIVATVQGLADTILHSSNKSNIDTHISKLNAESGRLIALRDIIHDQAASFRDKNDNTVKYMVVEKVPNNFMATVPVEAPASAAPASAAPVMPVANAHSAAAAPAPPAASANKSLPKAIEFAAAQLDESKKKAEWNALQVEAADLERKRNNPNTPDKEAAQILLDTKMTEIARKKEELNAAAAYKLLTSEEATRERAAAAAKAAATAKAAAAAKAAAGSSSHGGRRTKRKQTKRNRKQTKRNRTHRKNK
jgi:hypothetical protein